MINMTFTKGIGSPMYTAPEVLNKKYNEGADVFVLRDGERQQPFS